MGHSRDTHDGRAGVTDHDANLVQSVANVLAAAIDRVDKEQRLREREVQLDVASKAGSIGLWTWEIEENVVTADEYLVKSYGMDPEVVTAGAPMEAFYEPIHEDDTERTWKELERAVEETGELDVEFRVRGVPVTSCGWSLVERSNTTTMASQLE